MLTYSGGHQGSVNSDVITLRPQLLQGHRLHPPAGRHLHRSDGVVSNRLKGPSEASAMWTEAEEEAEERKRSFRLAHLPSFRMTAFWMPLPSRFVRVRLFRAPSREALNP